MGLSLNPLRRGLSWTSLNTARSPIKRARPGWARLPLVEPTVGVRVQLPKLRPFSSTICLSLPTAVKERVSSNEEVPKWSSRAIKSFAMGELEARKLKYPTTGTEAILMAILIEGTTLASKFLRSSGVTLFIAIRGRAIPLCILSSASKILRKLDGHFWVTGWDEHD